MKTSSFSVNKKDDISIVICGAAGQGIATVEQLLTRINGFKRTPIILMVHMTLMIE